MATYTPIELPMTVASDTPTLSMTVAGNLVIGGHVPVLQTKTVYPSSSDQTIEPDTGYDALDEVDVMAVVVTNLSAANIVDGVTVKVGDANDDDSIASVTGTAQTGITPTGTLEITTNGTENCSAYEYVDVDVANSYAVGDEGKVVHGGALVSQSSATYTQNNTYDTTLVNSVTVQVEGGGSATLGTKSVTANGTYKAEDDSLDGYSQVTVSVPASAVDTGTKSITANGNNQDVVGYAAVNVNVPNTYSAGDEGKVVSSGALVAQTAHADVTPTTSDQTIDTTTNNSIKVKGDADLVAGNIKKDVEIFGVTGSYEGGGNIDDLIAGTITTITSAAEKVEEYKFYNCTSLTSATFTENLWIKGNAFRGCSSLATFDAKKTYKIFGNAFMDVPADAIVFPNITGEMGSSAFASFKGTKLDLGGSNLEIKIAAFQNATNLNVLILRKSSRVVLAHTGAFDGTPFRSGGTGGTIYVPSALINDYKTASNWSTVYGYGTITFTAIEGSAYENYYADGTAIPT